jgi:potassium-transporting ATPase potassium-binding subunit
LNSILLSVIIILVLFILVARPTGIYLEKAFQYKNERFNRLFGWLEKPIFKLSGIKTFHQGWKQYALALVLLNAFMIVVAYFVFRFQHFLPLNPNGMEGMEPTLAFNTAISFMTNTDLQHYSGESSLSHLSQMVLIFLMFAAPATTLAIAMAFIRGLAGKKLGHFFTDFIYSITRVFLPISFIAAIVFVGFGVVQTLGENISLTTMEGIEQVIARGPVAAFESIKLLGNNGGGHFGVNSAHPFENPTALSNIVQLMLMMLLTTAIPFAYGRMVGNKKQGRIIFTSMFILFIIGVSVSLYAEFQGNPALSTLGMDATQGNMEGKEVRLGVVQSSLFSVVTTAAETGGVNAMHDSLTPIGGMIPLLNMLLNTVFGGVGAGFINVMMYVIIAVFISGLMVGRTPEFLGKKIEGKEMKLIALTLLFQPLLILGASAIALSTPLGSDSITNPGFHGLTQVIYEYTSSVANNGSGFEGLADATTFWNISTGVLMFLGRFFGLITMLAVAESLRSKPVVAETIGTFRTDTGLFGGIFVGTVVLVGALTFFPILVLGPIAEFLTLK